MPHALQHDSIRNFPDLGVVLMPGVATLVTPEQAEALAAHGITILPDDPQPIPFTTPALAQPEEFDR